MSASNVIQLSKGELAYAANARTKQIVKKTVTNKNKALSDIYYTNAPSAKPQVANPTTIASYFTDTIQESTYVDTTPESILPVDNINLCFVGGVSTGKSTILNAIFCEELTQCKIKRTTMVPTVYVENANDTPNLDNPENIFSKIAQKNKEIIEKTESDIPVSDSEYSELQFNVGKLDMNILPDSYVNVYDIPGLNDARTKSIYYKYLQRNFFKFNLIVFIVDIHSGLNTSDEADILNFIADHTRHQFDTNQKKIYTLVVVNKADDMQLIPESENDELELTGELNEMLDQVKNTVTEAFKRRNIAENLVGIIPLCAIDAYLYRMTQKHGDKFKLSPEQILKIGINENGKKFSMLKPATQEIKVREILNDSVFIETMIKLSGFGHFEKLLRSFLSQNGTANSIRIENLLFELSKLPKIEDKMKADADIETISNLCQSTFKIFNAIIKIDAEIGNQLVEQTTTTVVNLLNKYLAAYEYSTQIVQIESVINYYATFRDCVLAPYFEGDWSGFPKIVRHYVFNSVKLIFSTITLYPESCMPCIRLCQSVGCNLSAKIDGEMENGTAFEMLLDNILNNVNKFSTLEETRNSNAHITKFVEFGESLDVDMTVFMRFVLLNRICNPHYYTGEQLIQKQMMYLEMGEVPIYTYLQFVNSSRRIMPEWILNGVTPEVRLNPAHQLDIEYLIRETSKKIPAAQLKW